MRKIITLLLSTAMLFCLTVTAYADDSISHVEYEGNELKRFTFSCPIDMYIYDENGVELAFLTSEGYGSEENLSPDYFYGIGRRDGGWDYTAYIPYGGTAKIYGYRDSMLRVYVTEDGAYGKDNVEIFGDIPISSNSEGLFEMDSKGNVVLTVDNKEYAGTNGMDFRTGYDRSGANISSRTIIFVSVISVESIAIAVLAYFLIRKRKNSKE